MTYGEFQTKRMEYRKKFPGKSTALYANSDIAIDELFSLLIKAIKRGYPLTEEERGFPDLSQYDDDILL